MKGRNDGGNLSPIARLRWARDGEAQAQGAIIKPPTARGGRQQFEVLATRHPRGQNKPDAGKASLNAEGEVATAIAPGIRYLRGDPSTPPTEKPLGKS